MKKQCQSCKKVFSICNFRKDKNRKDKHSIYCKQCVSQRDRIYYLKNSERIKKYVRKWERKNKKQVNKTKRKYQQQNRKAYRSYELKCKYGITNQEFSKLLDNQNYRCAVCKRPFVDLKVEIDHNHKTGLVRGLLCRRCNALMGWVDQFKLLKRALKYAKHIRIQTNNPIW